MRTFAVSPSTLNLFKDCPRCFWNHVVRGEAYKRPSPPTSTLPSGMDVLIKKYFDRYRNTGTLPQELAAVAAGQLVSQHLIDQWRYWRTGLTFVDRDGSKIFGALDECLITGGAYVPVDYKTRGFALKEDSTSYYVLQMSCYNFLLRKNEHPVTDYAYLVFYIPEAVAESGQVKFAITAVKITTLPADEVYRIFREALAVLASHEPPPFNNSCSFCRWALQVTGERDSQLKLF